MSKVQVKLYKCKCCKTYACVGIIKYMDSLHILSHVEWPGPLEKVLCFVDTGLLQAYCVHCHQ